MYADEGGLRLSAPFGEEAAQGKNGLYRRCHLFSHHLSWQPMEHRFFPPPGPLPILSLSAPYPSDTSYMAIFFSRPPRLLCFFPPPDASGGEDSKVAPRGVRKSQEDLSSRPFFLSLSPSSRMCPVSTMYTTRAHVCSHTRPLSH